MSEQKSILISKLARIGDKRSFSLPLVESAIAGHLNRSIKHDMIVDSLTRSEFYDKLVKIRDCGTLFEIREYNNKPVIHNGNFCRNPLVCPVCADRVSRRRRAVWSPRIRKAVKKYPFVYMLVLTIKDTPDMKKQLCDLAEAKKRFRKMGQLRKSGARSEGEAGKIGAALCNTEIVFSDNGIDVHVHDHWLLFCREMIDYSIYDQEQKKLLKGIYGDSIPESELKKIAVATVNGIPVSKLSRQWYKATNGQGINIKCVPLNYKNYLENPKYKGRYVETYDDWLVFHSVECLKYNSKLSSDLENRRISAQQYSDLIQKRGSKRLFNTIGDFRKKNDSLYFDPQEMDRLDYIEEIKKSEYLIRSARYNQSKNDYDISAPLPGALFADSDPPGGMKRLKLSIQGAIMGEFRALRSGAMKYREKYHPEPDNFASRLERYLDHIRFAMKERIKRLWMEDLPADLAKKYCIPFCLS
jgi:hypothetical protein